MIPRPPEILRISTLPYSCGIRVREVFGAFRGRGVSVCNLMSSWMAGREVDFFGTALHSDSIINDE